MIHRRTHSRTHHIAEHTAEHRAERIAERITSQPSGAKTLCLPASSAARRLLPVCLPAWSVARRPAPPVCLPASSVAVSPDSKLVGFEQHCMAAAMAEEGTLQDEVPMLAQGDIIHQGWGTSRNEGIITSAPTAADVPPPTIIPPVRSEDPVLADHASEDSSSSGSIGLEVVAIATFDYSFCTCGAPLLKPVEGEEYLRCFECLERLPMNHPAAWALATAPTAPVVGSNIDDETSSGCSGYGFSWRYRGTSS